MHKTVRCDCSAAPASRRDALMLLAALGIGRSAAQAQDATKLEPRSYKVLFENAKVSVGQWLTGVGARPWCARRGGPVVRAVYRARDDQR